MQHWKFLFWEQNVTSPGVGWDLEWWGREYPGVSNRSCFAFLFKGSWICVRLKFWACKAGQNHLWCHKGDFFWGRMQGNVIKKKKKGMRQVLRPKSCTKNSPVPVQCSLLSFSFHSMLLQLVAGFGFFFFFFFLPAVLFLSFLDCFALVWFFCSVICSHYWRQVSVEEGEGTAQELNVLCVGSSAKAGLNETQGGAAQRGNSTFLSPGCCTFWSLCVTSQHSLC